ncbi:zinc finger protein 862-like [Ptychodera flava]|uniref:zinc finger protein 862-like n=1 Tax=Ptychodera flava TaxID=63121 RepID=UPI00396AA072
MEDDTIQRVQKSDFFSIMLDETTDVSVEEQLTLNCRFLDESGQLSVKFLKIIQPLNSKSNDEPNHLPTVSLNAETIARHVTSYFAEYGLNFDNLVGIGTDGAAVMTGKHNGVVKRLQQVATSAIGIHCCAHRLQLASTQAASSVPFVKKFTTIVRQLYDYFNNSAVRMAGLHAVQTALDQSVLNPIEPSSTRWLSMEASVRRLKDTFVSVLISLEREGEERGDAKAIGLFHLMSTYRFISTMLLLCDLLPHVSNLSKALQASDFEHSLVKPLVSSTVSTLRQLKTVDGENL